MPRGTRRRKDVVLLLPSPTSTSPLPPATTGEGSKPAVASTDMYARGQIYPAAFGSEAAGAAQDPYVNQSAAARLDVLLYAQRMAWLERGQIIDIEAFMTSDMREEWYRRSVPYYQPVYAVPQPIYMNGLAPQPFPAGPSTSPVASLPPPLDVQTDVLQPTLASSSAAGHVHLSASPSTSGESRKRRPSPSSASEHWKHRKRLSLMETEAAADGDNVGDGEAAKAGLGPDVASIPSFSITPAPPPGQSSSKKAGETSESDKVSIQQSASYWNSLLIQARKARGPQWDFNTQSFQVDQQSEDYYTHMGKLNPKYAEKEDGDDGDEEDGAKALDGPAAEEAKPIMAGPSSASDRRPGSSSGSLHRAGSMSGQPPHPDHTLRRSGSSSSAMQRTGSRPGGGGQSVSLDSPRSAVPGLPHGDRGPGSSGPVSGGPPHMVGSNGSMPSGHPMSNQANGAGSHASGGQMPMPPPPQMSAGGPPPPVQQQYGFSAAQLQGLMQQAQASGVNPAVLLAQVQAQARQNLSAAQAAGASGAPGGGRNSSEPGRPSSQGKGAQGQGQQPPSFGNMDYAKAQMNGRPFPGGGGPQQMQQQGGGNGINPALLAQMAGGGGGPGGQGGFMGQPGAHAARGYAPGQGMPGQGMPGQGQWSFNSS